MKSTPEPGTKYEQLVISLSRPSRCHGCDTKLTPGAIVQLKKTPDEREALCRQCAGLDALEVLLAGNARITRLAKKYSSVCHVIVKWSDAWKCYERIGLLVESQAVAKARRQALTRVEGQQDKSSESP